MSDINTAPAVFNFEAQAVRMVMVDGNPWFVAADVCKALGIGNPTKALRALDDDEQALTSIQGLSRGNDKANIVNESGLYTLILRCRDAVNRGTAPHRFRKWVTSEVLPAIRKTGRYEGPTNVRAKEEAEGLILHMLYIRSWWQRYSPGIAAMNRETAAKIHDNVIDGACCARALAHYSGFACDEPKIRNYPWDGDIYARTRYAMGVVAV